MNREKGEEVKQIVEAIKTVIKDYQLLKKKLITKKEEYDIEGHSFAAYTVCNLVCELYKRNDWLAACYAYVYTLPKIEEIVRQFDKHSTEKRFLNWATGSADYAYSYNEDGSKKQWNNLGYMFEYLYERQQAIAARYFIEHNIQYLEREKPIKDYPCRAEILKSAIWWANQGLLGRFGLKMPQTPKEYNFTPELIIFSTFPSSGKTYLNNTMNQMFIELNYIVNRMGGVLRVGNQEENILSQSRDTMNMILNPSIINIYPENKDFIINGKYAPFSKSSEAMWGLNGVKFTPMNTVIKTRDSAINSVRCLLGIFDDPSRGINEATDDKVHTKIVQLFRGDFSDRFVDRNNKLIMLTGTMYNPNDVFALESKKALLGAIQDTRFRNTWVNVKQRTVVILNDCEDELGHSAFPEYISDKELEKVRDGLDPYLYACVWRQKPIPAEGLIFAKEKLKHYDKLPEDISNVSYAYIDPTRKSAKDFFSMPICKFSPKNSEYYLTDFIYKQKSTLDLYDEVVDKIEKHKIVRVVIENNIDTSVVQVLNDRLKQRGISFCKIETQYHTKNKQERIAQMAYTILNAVNFPEDEVIKGNKDLSLALSHLSQYSAEHSVSNRIHDDCPDSLGGFAEVFIVDVYGKNTIKGYEKIPF